MARRRFPLSALLSVLFASALGAAPEWPLTLNEGLPSKLPGYTSAPRDPLPDTFENEMGTYTEASRLFQKIEPGAAKQFRIAVQDYGNTKNIEDRIRAAMTEASKSRGVSTAKRTLAGFPAYAITDRSGSPPTSLVTVVVSPGRLVLGQGSNVDQEEAIRLLSNVDFAKVVAAH